MNYQSPTKRNRHVGIRFFAFVLLIACLGAVLVLWRPLWGVGALEVVGMVNVWKERATEAVISNQSLVEENKQLRTQLAQQSEAEHMSELYNQSYLELYRSAFGYGDGVAAEVLLRPPYSPYDYYVINRGEKHGVEERQLVLVGNYYLVGWVGKVGEEQARVDLFSRPGFDFLVSVDGSLYPARGVGGGVVHIELPREYQNLKEPLAVHVPGAKPYIIGWIENISFDPQDSFVLGVTTMPENIFTLELVRVSGITYENHQNIDGISFVDHEEQ